MGLSRAKILVVDDNIEHGQKIADTLWKSGRHVLFVNYSEEALINKTYGVHSGVRAIFLDINLTGDGGIGGVGNLFGPAEQTLRTLLDDENGPFALITWSSHDDKANELYEHLRTRLPVGKRPVSLGRMDKDQLLQSDGEQEIRTAVLNNLSTHASLRHLTEWEGHVQNSAAAVIKNLACIAENNLSHQDFDKKLGCLLLQLARAEAGKWLGKSDDISSPLYSLMSSLLEDRLGHISNIDKYLFDEDIFTAIDAADLQTWKGEVNAFLHFDSSKSGGSTPGSLFDYPINRPDISFPVVKSKNEMGKCIRGNYLEMIKGVDGYDDRNKISEECQLLLMDVTPPCDHANKKVLWRRFVVTCRVPAKHIDCLWRVNLETKQRINGQLKGDHLRISPRFSVNGEEFVLAFNANLQCAVPEPKSWETVFGEKKGRIREQFLSDLMGWLGRHITRGGYVELR